MENQLQVIVNQSGLEATKASCLLEKFQGYFKLASEWEVKARTIKVTDESQAVDMKMARTGRLFLREKRIAIEKTRKQLKEEALREGKAIDGIANVLKALIIPIEEYLEKQEKFVEIRMLEKQETERIETERKVEEERIENERLDRVAQERKDMAMLYRAFWTVDEYAFRKMSQANFDSVMVDLRKRKSDNDKEQERIRKENEKLQREAEERERILERERKERGEERRRQEEASKKKQKELEAKAKKEREKLQREAEGKLKKEIEKKEKVEAELKAKSEVEKKAEQEKQRKVEAQKKASDKDKLLVLADIISSIEFPVVKSDSAKNILVKVHSLFKQAVDVIKKEGCNV